MYDVTWFRFEHGCESDAMISKSRSFDSFDKAKMFLLKRMQLISGLYWAGGFVEDSNGNLLFDISSDCQIVEKSRSS